MRNELQLQGWTKVAGQPTRMKDFRFASQQHTAHTAHIHALLLCDHQHTVASLEWKHSSLQQQLSHPFLLLHRHSARD
jgi:hypothetical protein